MTGLKHLSQLRKLTSAELMAAQSVMAAILAKERGLHENLTNLAAERQQVAQAAVSVDAATASGANIRWQKWADERRAVINMELAGVLAQKANAHSKLKRAFGKDQALATLIEQQSRAVQRLLNNRAI